MYFLHFFGRSPNLRQLSLRSLGSEFQEKFDDIGQYCVRLCANLTILTRIRTIEGQNSVENFKKNFCPQGESIWGPMACKTKAVPLSH